MGSLLFHKHYITLLKKMVLNLKVNFSKAEKGTVTLPLDSDITWNGFLKALEQEFAVPVDLLQLYSSSDEERECNYLDYVTEKDKKLVELAGLQEGSQYEMDLELPSADSNEPSRITVVSVDVPSLPIIEKQWSLTNLDLHTGLDWRTVDLEVKRQKAKN